MTRTPDRLLKALERRDGKLCCWHGRSCGEDTLVPQHRANRGMGGRPSAMVLPNLLWLCSAFNERLEYDDDLAAEAYERGIKISTYWDPEQIPVRYIDGWWLPEGNIRRYLRDDEAAELMALHGIRTEVAS